MEASTVIWLVIQLGCGVGGAIAAGMMVTQIGEGFRINAVVGAFGGVFFGQLLGWAVSLFVPPESADAIYYATSVIFGAGGGVGALYLISMLGSGSLSS